MTHIMLDLETLGTGSNATILSIGAVAFTLDSNIVDSIHLMVGPNDRGAVADTDTVLWWLRQSDDARARVAAEGRVPFYEALAQFHDWVQTLGEVGGVWGNSVAFDNVILRNAYDRNHLLSPIAYKQDRCYRTMKAMFPSITPDPFIGIKHDAVDDARNQALHLCKILRSI